MKIAVFDSGIGGLTVLAPFVKEAHKLGLCFEVTYLGDLANLPYGTKSPEQVKKLSAASMEWLAEHLSFSKSQEQTLVLIACNTASALALEDVKDSFQSYPQVAVEGVIHAGCERALELCHDSHQNSRVVILGTRATIQTHVHKRTLQELKFKGRISEKACPLFVPLVEENLFEGPITDGILGHYLDGFLEPNDIVILGCTHYPLLVTSLEKKYPTVKFVDPGIALAKKLIQGLKKPNNSSSEWTLSAHFTDNTVNLEKLSNLLKTFHVDIQKLSIIASNK